MIADTAATAATDGRVALPAWPDPRWLKADDKEQIAILQSREDLLWLCEGWDVGDHAQLVRGWSAIVRHYAMHAVDWEMPPSAISEAKAALERLDFLGEWDFGTNGTASRHFAFEDGGLSYTLVTDAPALAPSTGAGVPAERPLIHTAFTVTKADLEQLLAGRVVARIPGKSVIPADDLFGLRLAASPEPASSAPRETGAPDEGGVEEIDVDHMLGLPRGLHLGDAVDHVWAALGQSRRVGSLIREERPTLARLITVARAMVHRVDEAQAAIRKLRSDLDAALRAPRDGGKVPAELRDLSERATPGEWRVETDTTLVWGGCTVDEDGHVERMGVPVVDAQLARGWSKDGQPDRAKAQYNAALSAAAVNAVRSRIAAEDRALAAERGEGK